MRRRRGGISMTDAQASAKPSISPLYDPRVRAFVYQAALLLVLGFLVYEAVVNASMNMRARGIPTDFSFWNRVSGFDVNQTLIDYSAVSTYGKAFWVGLLNTLLVGAIGVVLTTFVGFAVGIARLSPNFVVAKLATFYVEILRNTPLLLQLLFWYNAVLKPLPNPRDSISLGAGIFVNNRGLILPDPQWGPGADWVMWSLVIGCGLALVFRAVARKRQADTGQILPVGLVSLLLIVGLPLIVFFAMGRPLGFEIPVLRGFNFAGGVRVLPEFVALLLGLVLYTAAFIAEIVRAGILSVSKGQTEAAYALGLTHGQTLKLVVIPQAMRVIIPPLTNQYLNLIKNSSLAVFIGYPDLVQVFAGTVLNQTGAAVQVIAITMAVYLVISLVTSFFMNIYNRRKALVER
ncbi:MAG: amino acid transporter permease [Hyphomicrobiales bacterium]|nr:amino acid transporter permease [Hyphomicrobiales bacterium]